ncbi:MAG: hypothetical protein RJB39_694 [Candidatus Parcubacteria bacterium]|jgi:hypothetical protein
MRYQVPQFIEFESKIIGPFSFRQFAYILGGAGGTYLIYKLLGFFPGILLILPLVAMSVALAFLKINGRKFIDVLASAFSFFVGGKLYVWKKIDKPVESSADQAKDTVDEITSPSLSQSKLKDLAWGLDIKQNVFSTESLEKSAKH